MLRLLLGKAGTGKTAAVIEEIKRAVDRCEGKRLYIVPEQYSHEAERELCRSCGDRLSLFAETLSFTGLARRVMARQGGGALPLLDKGGRLLCMALALESVGPRLKVYPAARRKAELQAMLLRAVDELKSACVSSDMLLEAAARFDDSLGDKLSDMALVLEGYGAVVGNGHADPADRLSLLADMIPKSDIDGDTYVYIDGFIDFTRQERELISALLRKGAQLCVCLTVDSLDGSSEIYELSRRAARSLRRAAVEAGAEVRVETMEAASREADALDFFADNMFSYSDTRFEGDGSAVQLFRAEGMAAECELAAARCIELARDEGCRWRDMAVAVRGFEDYRGTLESVFRHYGVPLYTARRSDLLSKPLPAMIAAAYDTVLGGWAVADVISYMRTGLAGLDSRECDILESYIYKWQLRAGDWRRRGDWRQHPEGYGHDHDDETTARLAEINELRRRLAGPLLRFSERAEQAETASGQAAALAGLLEQLHLPETLAARSAELEALGRETLAAEYRQLWELCVSALEQCAAILGESELDAEEFGRLFMLVLSQYDIGTIPVSLDRVSAGDFDRNRRRHIKHLIVLGADDQRLPMSEDSAGVFSQDERRRLLELDIDLSGGGEDELWREFSLIYHTLTLPSESLTLCCPLSDSEGAERRPSFVFNRAGALFGISAPRAELSELRMSAPAPALSLAAMGLRGGGVGRAALEYFERAQPERCKALRAAAEMTRGRLSPKAVELLYGKRLRLSASRIDRFSSCRFAYFCQYGLRAKPYEPAGFTPPEIGSFMHYVLEKTAAAVKGRGGFGKVSDGELRELCSGFVEQYVREELNDFLEKSPRFVYLFRRLSRDVRQVVEDMAAELRRSDFEPLDFELDFANASDIPPIELGEGEERMTLSGIADRVDGWVHEGKLYLRVVDYKTGKKQFSLSDIWYGMGLQMLLYLFALEQSGAERYGLETVPAGVMYIPARDPLIPLTSAAELSELEERRQEQKRRSGLVLNEAALIEAWERGEEKRYIPVKPKRGKLSDEALASAERLGLMQRHIKRDLREMAKQLRRGSIAADPFYRSQQENACLNCDYFDACHFSDGENGESSRYMPKLSADKVWSMMEGAEANE